MSKASQQIAFRLEKTDLEKIRDLQYAIKAAVGHGVKVSTSAVIRYCIARTHEAEIIPPEKDGENEPEKE